MSPGTLDTDTIRRHLAALDAAVSQLRRHAGQPLSRLESDLDELWVVERGLQIATQNVLDIATHIAASAGRDVPDYASAIDVLGSLGVLTNDFARSFRPVAGFRNLLVHGYLEVDKARLHRLLNERLDDFTLFGAAVSQYLSTRP